MAEQATTTARVRTVERRCDVRSSTLLPVAVAAIAVALTPVCTSTLARRAHAFMLRLLNEYVEAAQLAPEKQPLLMTKLNQKVIQAKLEYDESGQIATPAAPKVANYEHTNYGIGWDGGFGAWRFATQFIKAGEGECKLTSGTCSTAGLGATLWTVGARWRFDRQTFIYTIGALLRNGVSAAYNNNSSQALASGADTKNFAIGISYSF